MAGRRFGRAQLAVDHFLESAILVIGEFLRTAFFVFHDEGAGGAAIIVQKSFVPFLAGVVDVDAVGGGEHRRESVPVINRVKGFEVQDRGAAGDFVNGELDRLGISWPVFEELREITGAWFDFHLAGIEQRDFGRRFRAAFIGSMPLPKRYALPEMR